MMGSMTAFANDCQLWYPAGTLVDSAMEVAGRSRAAAKQNRATGAAGAVAATLHAGSPSSGIKTSAAGSILVGTTNAEVSGLG